MKRVLLFLIVLTATNCIIHAQKRNITRGAGYGELYLTSSWYGIYNPIWGPPYYDTLQTAVYRLTENGKKLTIQYDADYFSNLETVMQPYNILADATHGVVYNVQHYSKNYYPHTSLWVSFDYGRNWMFREENIGSNGYSVVNVEGVIFRFGVDGAYKSEDYGNNFIKAEIKGIGSDPGLQYGEGFGISGYNPYQYSLSHTYNFYESYTQIPIDSQYVDGLLNVYPDVYRGGLPGEVYVSSEFLESDYKVSYKASFSVDTGYTFRHVYISEPYDIEFSSPPLFMSDREPGVFYIIWCYQIEDYNPWGWHLKFCVEYYRDYGETLVDTYCHDINKNYKNEVGIEELPITNYELRVYPNPTTGELTIDNGELTIINVEVFDVYGRKQNTSHSSPLISISISYLPAGIYFIKATTEQGIITKKVVKY